ncbi:MAG: DUF2069 domain-containing protein [Thiotrichaceae bacterium]
MKYLIIWRILAITGLLGLIFLIIAWNGWLSPVQKIPRSIELLILLTPLLFFVRGILNGRYSTHVAVAFPGIIYFVLGVWYAFTPKEEIYGYLMILLSCMLYLGGFLYARTLMKRDKVRLEEAK